MKFGKEHSYTRHHTQGKNYNRIGESFPHWCAKSVAIDAHPAHQICLHIVQYSYSALHSNHSSSSVTQIPARRRTLAVLQEVGLEPLDRQGNFQLSSACHTR